MLHRMMSFEDNWKCWMLISSGEDLLVYKKEDLWHIVGGDVQVGEAPVDAITREVTDTIGLKLYDITLLKTFPLLEGGQGFLFSSKRYEGGIKENIEDYPNFKWEYRGYLQNYMMEDSSKHIIGMYLNDLMV